MSQAGEQLYQGVCAARNLDAAVMRLTREELAVLAEYISGLKPTGGVPAQVWGMVSARLAPEPIITRSARRKR